MHILFVLKTSIRNWSITRKIYVLMRPCIVKLFFYLINPLNPALYEKVTMWMQLGYWPNLKNPRSLNEKIVYRKLFNMPSLAVITADKWRVREYVKERVSEDILTKVYWVGDSPEEIPFESLPEEYVIKANHGCGLNIFVRAKSDVNRSEIIMKCRKWLNSRIGKYTNETHMDRIKPLIMIEEFLRDGSQVFPTDYKFNCFYGVVYYIYVHKDKEKNWEFGIYNRDWELQDFSFLELPTGDPIPAPRKLPEMINIAEKLSKGIDFIRIDMYCLNDDRIVIGEMTWTPTGGHCRYNPVEADFRLGKLW